MIPPTRTEKKKRPKTRGAPENDSGRAPTRASRTPGKGSAVRRTATGLTAPVTAEPSSGRASGKPRPAERSAEAEQTKRRAPERTETQKAAAARKTASSRVRPVRRRTPSRASKEPEGPTATEAPSRAPPRRSAEAEPEPPVGETGGRMEGSEAPPPHAPKRGSRKKRGTEVGPLDPDPSVSDRRV